jgi:hypothetical protein
MYKGSNSPYPRWSIQSMCAGGDQAFVHQQPYSAPPSSTTAPLSLPP